MQTNGKADREQVRSMLLMMMYLVQEANEQGLKRTEQVLQSEIEQLTKDYEITENDLFPEKEK